MAFYGENTVKKKNCVLWRKYCKEKRMAFYGENTVKKKEQPLTGAHEEK